MKLEKDYAIIETLAEWELFNPDWKDIADKDDFETLYYKLLNGTYFVTREQVKDKIIPDNNKYVFWFFNDIITHDNQFPPTEFIDNHFKNIIYLKVNSLTINRTIGELKELWRWANETH